MIDINGRFFAALVAILAGAALAAGGAYVAVMQRLTGREALIGFVILVIGAVAALWLRRDKLHGGRS